MVYSVLEWGGDGVPVTHEVVSFQMLKVCPCFQVLSASESCGYGRVGCTPQTLLRTAELMCILHTDVVCLSTSYCASMGSHNVVNVNHGGTLDKNNSLVCSDFAVYGNKSTHPVFSGQKRWNGYVLRGTCMTWL